MTSSIPHQVDVLVIGGDAGHDRLTHRQTRSPVCIIMRKSAHVGGITATLRGVV